MIEKLNENGAALLRKPSRVEGDGFKPEDETELLIQEFEKRGFDLIGTHFGRIEDLRTDNTTNKNTDQLGYTDSAINLHTDQPFLQKPPKYQILQCIKCAEIGGDNFVVDAFAAAKYFEENYYQEYQMITKTEVKFHRVQKNFEATVESPVLNFTGEPKVENFMIRYSYFTMDPFNYPFNMMAAFYNAYDKFARLVRNPDHQYKFLLKSGDILIYDNHRMLHARNEFKGSRWLRGIYLHPKKH